ncbi:MAG: cell division protein SepF [Clostridia bacterium]|nr:cell division protein SepF [Clostridia bacterium]
MSFKDKLSNWINVTDDSYVDGAEEFEDDFDFNPSEVQEDFSPKPAGRQSSFHSKIERNSNVVNINSTKPVSQTKPRVVFQKIDRFAEVNKVADILKQKRIVVLNLESCLNEDAQRIIDVLYGVSYANDGDFKKIADRAYIITPNNVPVTGELGDEISSAPEDDF